jgi:hypothetical protein
MMTTNKGSGEFLRKLAADEDRRLALDLATQAEMVAEFSKYFDKVMEIAVARLKRAEAFNQ